MRIILPLVFAWSLLWTVAAAAQSRTAEDFHRDGVAAFRKSDYPAAKAAFEEALKLAPDNPAALYNLGLIEYRSGRKGMALGLWRKALTISPNYPVANYALDYAQERMPRAITRDPGLWETFRSAMLVSIPLASYLFLTALLLFLTGWLALRYVGNRRRAILDERPLPPFPAIATLFGVLLLASVLLAAAKAYDLTVVRATVLIDKQPAHTVPDPQSTALFDLFEGSEVIVRQSHGDWLQVTVPGGLTGWVPEASVLQASSSRAVR